MTAEQMLEEWQKLAAMKIPVIITPEGGFEPAGKWRCHIGPFGGAEAIAEDPLRAFEQAWQKWKEDGKT